MSFIYFRDQRKIFNITKKYNDVVYNVCKTRKVKTLASLESVIGELCRNACKYFQVLKRSDKIGSAIRIAIKNKENKIVYKTFGRSNLSEDRAKTSQDISENDGIPNYFRFKKYRGVLIYNDIEGAINQKLFLETENEKNTKTI
jgi:hypothetical protein